MINNKTLPCVVCEHGDICRYADELKQEFERLKNSNHPLFDKNITCKKFKDTRCKR